MALYRLRSSKDHFYTASLDEAMDEVSKYNYTYEGRIGSVPTTASECQLKAVYRLLNQGSNDHFYTTNHDEATNATLIGYSREGIAFYCAASVNECGATVTFYRFIIGSDHFYTTNVDEGFTAVKGGGKYEGIMCYIWP